MEDLLAFHQALKQTGNDSEYYVGKGAPHGFCNGRNPKNQYFYWSLELEDQFLVKHGILTGRNFPPYHQTWSRISMSKPEEMEYFVQVYRRLFT